VIRVGPAVPRFEIVAHETLADAIARVGGPVPLLRNSPVRPHTFPVRPEFTNWRSEQRAWRESCVLFDQSHHMTDLYLRGPGALSLLAGLGVNSFRDFGAGRAKQYVAVAPDGYFVGDAILFHLADDEFDLVGHPTVHDWIEFHLATGQHDVTARRDDNSADRAEGPPLTYRYELQGPTAMRVIEHAAGPVGKTRFFHLTELTIAGRPVRALRHGMAGQPGFELFGPWADHGTVRDAVLAAGEPEGLVLAGAKAYSTANLESGWIPSPLPAIFGDDPLLRAYREWLPADRIGSLGGSLASQDITDHYVTPYDLGYGRHVAFDHDFVGRAALERHATAPHRTKVTLVWNSDDVTAAMGSLHLPGPGAKYIELPKSRYALYQSDTVTAGGAAVGISMDCGYLANERSMVSLATVDATHGEPGTEVVVLWGEDPNSTKPAVEEHVQVPIRATVAPAPLVDFARNRYRAQ
jgi:glycine cleavage system aminomethyltransferase T